MKAPILAAALAAIALAAAPALASSGSSKPGTQQPAGMQSSGAAAQKDKSQAASLVGQIARGGMAEVEAGKLAQKKASNPEVKKFAEHMVEDHGKANQELMQLAQSKNMTVPKDVGPQHKAEMDKLSKASGAQFDRQYIQGQVKDHQKMIDMLQKTAREAEDPQLKQWAQKMVPAVQEHLKHAQQIQGQLASAEGQQRPKASERRS